MDTLQVISASEAANGMAGNRWTGRPDVTYQLNAPPFTRYRWNGSKLLPQPDWADAAGSALLTPSGSPVPAVPDVGFANPMTTAGDTMVGGVAGAATRLAKGADGKVLSMVAGAVGWADAGGGGGGASQEVPVAGVGTLTFTDGLLTGAADEVPAPAYDTGAVHFGGIDSYVSCAALDCVDTPCLSGSFWYRSSAADNYLWVVDPDGNGACYLSFVGTTEAPRLDLGTCNTDASLSDEVTTPSSVGGVGWHHVIFSLDANARRAAVYVDGLNVWHTDGDLGGPPPQYDVALNGMLFALGKYPGWNSPPMDLADFWLSNESLLDGTGHLPAVTRRKFRSDAGLPVSLGTTGNVPTGTAALVFFHATPGDEVASFVLNRGTGGITAFSGTALSVAATSPSDTGETRSVPVPGVGTLAFTQGLLTGVAGGGAAVYPRMPMLPGRFYRGEGATEQISTAGLENILLLTRLAVTNPIAVDSLRLGVPADSVNQMCRMGVYRVSDDALSADLVSEGSGEVAPTTPVALTGVTLTPGVYLLGVILGVPGAGGTAVTCRALSSGDDKSPAGVEFGADTASYLFGSGLGNGLFDYSYTYSALLAMPPTLDLTASFTENGAATPVVLVHTAPA